MSLSFVFRASACALGALAISVPALADPVSDAELRQGADLLVGLVAAARSANNDDVYGGRGYGNRGSGLVLFEDPGLRGQRYSVSGEIRHLRNTGFNDEVSSLQIRSGNWQVCSDPDFRGTCRVFNADTLELRRFGLNDNISSVRPVSDRRWNDRDDDWGMDRHGDWGRDRGRDDNDWARGRGRDHDWNRGRGRDDDWGRGRGRDDDWSRDRNDDDWSRRDYGRAGVVLFTDPDGRGRALPVDGAIRYLQPLGFNDNISSILVRSGAWEVCSDPDYRGRCRVIDNSVGYTLHIQLNDNISSIRPAYGRDRDRRDW